MTDTELQAHEFVRRKEWHRAIELYDKLLSGGSGINKNTPRERIVACLLGRSECCLELGRHEAVVADCRRIIKLLADGNDNNNGSRARKRLVHALFSLRRFSEAELATREWLLSGSGAQNHPEAVKTLERLRSILQLASGQKGGNVRMLQQKLDEELVALESRFEALTGHGHKENYRRNRKHPVELLDDKKKPTVASKTHTNSFQQQLDLISNSQSEHNELNSTLCSYCRLTFVDLAELRAHCQSDSHQTVIMSDEGRDWKWRAPPRGFKADTYSLCENFTEGGTCRYGAQCVEAHGPEELSEWRERFEYRRMKLQRACEKELYGKSYTEQILDKWIQAASPDKVLKEKLDGVDDSCSADLVTSVSSKSSKREWIFVLKTKKPLRAVALLQDAHRNHFVLKQVILGIITTQKKTKTNKPTEVELTSDQEWCPQNIDGIYNENSNTLEHRVKVAFTTDIYGTFRQSVVFDFGSEPVLVKHLCVDVIPVTDADRIKEIRKEIVLSSAERWDLENSEIVTFTSPINPVISGTSAIAGERDLLNLYPSPRADTFTLTHSTIVEKKLTKNNYRARMHELLCVEEMARYEQVARYNLTSKLRIAHSYLLAPNGLATSTAKYSHSGELFALMTLGKDVSEDTSAGRLILNNCTTVLITIDSSRLKTDDIDTKRKVYEALIEDKGKNMIYLRLSAITVKELNLKPDTDFLSEVQFQLNRIPYCEWHYAIDKIADFRVIFPETYLEPNIPWTPQRQWSDMLDSRLNLKQKEAVVAITTPVTCPLPPILIIGPFGTGKTYTLAQAIKQLLLQSDTKILICTHSNSAADLYIKDYLHPYVEAGHEEARPLRIYYHKRWVATVNQVVQKYCLIDMNGGVRSFRVPTLEDIMKHRIIVVTLSISMYLSTMGLQKGHFTHILLDEAAQAMECEAIMPLALANENTRIVLAGDHMQLSPELFSEFAKERNLHVSLLERLYDHYPTTFPCKILLCENYRAHEAIIQFTSELFYDQKLISSGKQPRHDKFYPLTFFTTRGEDVQDQNSTAFYNNSEVYEVVERVCELRKRWPTAWGKMDDQSIGIMTPYADQVFRIRSELRKRRMAGISVERVLNVQGKQFRAIFLSTVRTRRTCTGIKPSGDEMDYGFLSNSKLLNTAITRAQSLVAVVGDPVALCSIGRCRKVWERFIEICNENKSLFGITWALLRSQLDGVELKKTYVLNPLAPEFIPRQFQPEAYIKMPINNFNSIPQQPIGTSASMPAGAVRYPTGPVTTGAALPAQFVIPPSIPAGGTPMISLPLYCFSTPPTPQAHIVPVRPLGPPQLPYPTNNPPMNPWAVNYSVISPPGGRSTPTNWLPKIIPQQSKKTTPLVGTLKVNMRAPTLPGPLRSPGGVPFANVMKNGTASAYIPLPVPRSDVTDSPSSNFMPDTYIPGDVFTNNCVRGQIGNSNIIGPQNFNHLVSLPNKMTESFQQQHQRKLHDKEHIQFLNNVHFPERTQQQNVITPYNLPNEINAYLPQNVSLGEMLLQPPMQHYEWYRHLIDVAGIDTANRFMELLVQAKKQHDMTLQANVAKSIDELLNDKSIYNTGLAPLNATLQQLNLLPNWSPCEKPLDSLPNFPSAKPVLLRDLETSLMAGNIPNLHPFEDMRDMQRLNRIPDNIRLPWQNTPAQQSVPLYRRQSQMVSNSPQDHNLLESNNEKQKQAAISSNAFAGYARAALNIQQQSSVESRPTTNNQPPPFYNNSYMQQLNQLHQQQLQQQINADFANLSAREGETVEEMLNRQQETTYASVLRASGVATSKPPEEKNGDPFAVLRDLGHKSANQNNGGLYQYFS